MDSSIKSPPTYGLHFLGLGQRRLVAARFSVGCGLWGVSHKTSHSFDSYIWIIHIFLAVMPRKLCGLRIESLSINLFLLITRAQLLRVPRITCGCGKMGRKIDWRQLVIYVSIIVENAFISATAVAPIFYSSAVCRSPSATETTKNPPPT